MKLFEKAKRKMGLDRIFPSTPQSSLVPLGSENISAVKNFPPGTHVSLSQLPFLIPFPHVEEIQTDGHSRPAEGNCRVCTANQEDDI